MKLEQKLKHFKSNDHVCWTFLCNTRRSNSPPPMCSSQDSKNTYNITNSLHTVHQNILFTGNVSEQDSFGHKLSETNRSPLPPEASD